MSRPADDDIEVRLFAGLEARTCDRVKPFRLPAAEVSLFPPSGGG